jgi:MFS family permease
MVFRQFRSELTGRAAVAVVGVLLGLAFMGSTLVTPLYVIYEKTFGFSQLVLTLIYAVYVIGNLVALLLLGRLSDTIGRRWVSLAAIAVGCVSALVFLFAQGTAWLFWARMTSGLAIGLTAGTATAWLADLDPDKSRAARIATSTNFLGLALGSVLAGLLAQFAPWPLQLPFIMYLVALVVIALAVWRTDETVTRVGGFSKLSLWPRVGIPADIRRQFVAPALAVFNAMALVGFYVALIPSILVQSLHEESHAVAGAVVGELTLVVAAAIVASYRMSSRTAMLWGLWLLFPSVACLVATQAIGSMALLLVGTVISGISTAFGYRGSLEVVNQIAPEDRRAEVVSTYFVVGFTGNAVPVVGLGIIAGFANLVVASAAFAVMIAAFAVIGLIVEAPGKRSGKRSSPRPASVHRSS